MEDPVEARADDSTDLYDVTTWEPRTRLDRIAVRTYRGVLGAGRAMLILLGFLILTLILLGGLGAVFIDNPFVVGLVVLSVVPAGFLALYVYVADVTTREPPTLLAATFLLAILFAGFAAVINTAFAFLQIVPFVGFILFFYLVVGPVEEVVKLLAVWLYPYRSPRFDSVVDGAVYGAVAGLGFATIENAVYISGNLVTPAETAAVTITEQISTAISAGGEITAIRGLAGPGHVIYSAFAGYYLGLAKFNPDDAGPIVVKGLLIAAFIHATYNTLVGIVPALVSLAFPGIPILVLFFGFVVVYQGFFGYILYRKLKRYTVAYRQVHGGSDVAHDAERTEFDPR
ncbi:MAG: PrsW family intramembrane metalloprotease [Natronomonas sp.]